MSTSGMSITATPASSARQRPVVLVEKRSSVEFVSKEAALSQANGGGPNKGDMVLGKFITVETSGDGSKKTVLLKNDAGVSSVLPRRIRRVHSHPVKPWWKTILSVLTKNLLLFIALLGLTQLFWKLAHQSSDTSLGIPTMVSDFEGRIAELNGFLKKTTKMMQLQVEAVDRKVADEVGSLNKMIEEKSVELANEVKRLDSRADGLHKMVEELGSMNFLTKEEFDKLYTELKVSNDDGKIDKRTAFDGVIATAKKIVEMEIEKHAADGLGMLDYALASGGAMVVKHSEPFIRKKGPWFPLKAPNGVHSEAVKMLTPSFGEPGACFPLVGKSGFVQIRLRTAIVPEAVTLEHVAKGVGYDRSSAPKECRVMGWLQGKSPAESTAVAPEGAVRLVEFTYDLEKSSAQTFKVAGLEGSETVDTVRFEFESNHGSLTHTCVYRVRVHGYEPKSVSMVTDGQGS